MILMFVGEVFCGRVEVIFDEIIWVLEEVVYVVNMLFGRFVFGVLFFMGCVLIGELVVDYVEVCLYVWFCVCGVY